MTSSYLFYDIETTGLNKAFDQVLSFAAIRTDPGLNAIERHTITVKLRPDVIPSPGAILTNRIPVSDLSKGLCEFEATEQIHQLMNQAGTISLGYNTLGFDDEFLRFSFHRNLMPPYTITKTWPRLCAMKWPEHQAKKHKGFSFWQTTRINYTNSTTIESQPKHNWKQTC